VLGDLIDAAIGLLPPDPIGVERIRAGEPTEWKRPIVVGGVTD